MSLNRVAIALVSELKVRVRLEVAAKVFQHPDMLGLRVVHTSRGSTYSVGHVWAAGNTHIDKSSHNRRIVFANVPLQLRVRRALNLLCDAFVSLGGQWRVTDASGLQDWVLLERFLDLVPFSQ